MQYQPGMSVVFITFSHCGYFSAILISYVLYRYFLHDIHFIHLLFDVIV